jgi:type II secretion system protein G
MFMVKITSNKGFTLLELILVVIVIGILATLAVPQFTDLAEKARAAEAINTIGAIKTAQDLYKIETNSYTSTIGDLSVTVPTSGATTYWTYSLEAGANATEWGTIAVRSSKKAPTSPPQGQNITMSWNDSTGSTWSGDHKGRPAN